MDQLLLAEWIHNWWPGTGAVLCEQNDEWMVSRCYMTQETLAMAGQVDQMKQESLTTGFTSLPGAAA